MKVTLRKQFKSTVRRFTYGKVYDAELNYDHTGINIIDDNGKKLLCVNPSLTLRNSSWFEEVVDTEDDKFREVLLNEKY